MNTIIDKIKKYIKTIYNDYTSPFIDKFLAQNKKTRLLLLLIFSSVFIAFTSQTYVFSNDKISALEANIGNTSMGYLPIGTTENSLIEQINIQLEKAIGNPVKINDTIILTEIKVKEDKISTIDSFVEVALKEIDYSIIAKKLYINDQFIGIVENETTCDVVLEKISKKYKTASTEETIFLDKIEFEDYPLQEEKILTEEELTVLLDKNVTGETTYTISENDTLWDISINKDIPLNELYKMNELTEDSILSIGEEIILSNSVPFIDVKTKEVITYETDALPEIEYIENSEEYITYEKIIEEGTIGKKIVTEEITKINGLEEKTALLNEEIIEAPTKKVVEIGTSPIPPTKAIGNFINPSTTGRISDYFMARNGKHEGIDVALAYGSNVLASDGGVVTFSGWMNGYGNLIIIDHENGYETYYGHNSSLTVSVGTRVYQGQVVAKVGSTGRSTGNHIHLEVLLNGVPKNPLDYIPGY